MAKNRYHPVVLIIRDGWGANHNENEAAHDAIKLAPTPVADALDSAWPATEIAACGRDVGLPDAVMGNSEVGHQNIGAGRIVDQEILRIDKAFENDTVKDNPVLEDAIGFMKKYKGRLHLFGLVSDAGVHSMLRHLYGLLKTVKAKGVREVYIHAFTDGRDTSPTSGINFIKEVEEQCAEIGVGRIATVCGRFWAMDRDKRWDRVQKAYECLTGRDTGHTAESATDAVQHYYDNPLDESRQGDEFITPTQIIDQGEPVATVDNGDAVIFFNFRGDRPRELTRAFIDRQFNGFDRGPKLDIFFATMTAYEEGLCDHVLFHKPPRMKHILGSWVSDLGIGQFRCAETEKYPHVTFFFNDYREEPFEGEDRVVVPSPKEVSTYDQKPEMSARGVCDATLEAIRSGKYGLIVVNFANPDMVGHTGSLDAAVKACAFVDQCVGEILEAVDEVKARAVITADHGNSDLMYDHETDGPHTRHTLNPVKLIVYGEGCADLRMRDGGRLADIAPTLLRLMELPQPVAMTGESLVLDDPKTS